MNKFYETLLYIPQILLFKSIMYELGRQVKAQCTYLIENHIVGGKTESESRIAIRRHYFRSQSVRLRLFVFTNFILYKNLILSFTYDTTAFLLNLIFWHSVIKRPLIIFCSVIFSFLSVVCSFFYLNSRIGNTDFFFFN